MLNSSGNSGQTGFTVLILILSVSLLQGAYAHANLLPGSNAFISPAQVTSTASTSLASPDFTIQINYGPAGIGPALSVAPGSSQDPAQNGAPFYVSVDYENGFQGPGQCDGCGVTLEFLAVPSGIIITPIVGAIDYASSFMYQKFLISATCDVALGFYTFTVTGTSTNPPLSHSVSGHV
jgi:hypothetical protein